MKLVCLLSLVMTILCSCSRVIADQPKAKITYRTSSKQIDFTKKIQCTLQYLQEATFEENNIQLEGPASQDFGVAKTSFEFHKDGEVFIWMDFNGEKNKQGEELPPAKGYVIANDLIKVVVIDCSNNMSLVHTYPCFIHTFFKDSGTYIYHKVNSIAATMPRGTMSMGYCR